MKSTPKAKSFLDILEEQIRTEVRKELQQEMEGHAPSYARLAPTRPDPKTDAQVLQMDLWLSSHIQHGRPTGSVRARSAYRPQKPNLPPDQSSSSAAPVSEMKLTPQQSFALEIICRFAGASVPSHFTLEDLKGIWRRAALKTHPDRVSPSDPVTQARATALFRELSEAHDLLKQLFAVESAA